MFGLDERIAEAANGASIWIVLAVAVLLGLRHATDPDHLAAVTTLVASGRERAPCRAAELGLAWGFGHAVTLFAFGLPVLLLNDALPPRVQQVAETAIGFVIVYLALRLLLRWRRGELRFHAHPHAHGARTRRAAFAIGLVHGMAGSAGVGVLVLASVSVDESRGRVARGPRRVHGALDEPPVARARLVTRLTSRPRGVRRRRARVGRSEPCVRCVVRDSGLEPRAVPALGSDEFAAPARSIPRT